MSDPGTGSGSGTFRPFPLHPKATKKTAFPTTGPASVATDAESEAKPPAPRDGGSSAEVVKRPRGRPPGSKNKPKPPQSPLLLPPSPSPDLLRPHLLEIPSGHDLPSTLSLFSRTRNLCLSVLSASGSVAEVTLRHSPPITLRGPFHLLSLSATFFPPSSRSSPSASVTLAHHQQGQVLGGIVAGPLLAAGTVTVLAAVFANPTFHRLPAADDGDGGNSPGGSGKRLLLEF